MARIVANHQNFIRRALQLRLVFGILQLCLQFSGGVLGQTFLSLNEAKKTAIDSVFYLEMSNQKLTQFPMEILKYSNLKGLRLNKNNIQKIPDSISCLTNLTFIDLSENPFDYFPQQVVKLIQLETLVLDKNKFTIVPEVIGKLVHLKQISFYKTPVKSFPASFYNLQNLEKIEFGGIKRSQVEQNMWKKKMPWIQFNFGPSCNCMG